MHLGYAFICDCHLADNRVQFLHGTCQISQFEDVKFEAASILSEFYCQQVNAS